MRRLVIAIVLGAALAKPAFASEANDQPSLPVSDAAVPAAVTSVAPAASPELATRSTFTFRRPSTLPALYATSAALQGYDTFSTLSALKSGAREANPLMKSVVKSPTAFVVMKAGVTAGSIMAAEQLWKNHHRMGAIGMMVASNVMMGIVAVHNSHVLSQLK